MDEDRGIEDNLIIPYEGNETLIMTTNEPEKEITLAKEELIICSTFDYLLKKGKGVVCNYSNITSCAICNTDGASYCYCIPMSKYNPNNLEETSKWIFTVKNGKLVKLNK